MILSGRRLNDGMGKLIAEKAIKNLIKNGVTIKGAKVLLMGLTFKENCPDLRNSKVVDIINELSDYGVEVIVVDPIADKLEAKKEYDVDLIDIDKIENVDGIIIAVAHKEYKSLLPNDYIKLFKNNLDAFTLIDVKSILDKNIFDNKFDIWRL
jgi:UDP-N-acetyl-D-galactosamine dehydrogenase